MLLDRKPLIYLWRPVHRVVFEGIFWPFVARVGKSMLGEIKAELTVMERRLASIEHEQQRYRAQLEAENRAQWQSIEELLLCILRDPGVVKCAPENPEHQMFRNANPH
jgi:hypothetical protein